MAHRNQSSSLVEGGPSKQFDQYWKKEERWGEERQKEKKSLDVFRIYLA